MPVQTQQNSSFARKMGGRVAEANAEHAAKPVDLGNRQLPPGIKNGVAKLSTMYTKEYADDANGPGTKGQTFFRASAVVLSPDYVQTPDGPQKAAGLVTSVIIPLCDLPAKGKRKAKTFSENWYAFQNLFKMLGIAPPAETPQSDPTGQRTEAYYFAAMKTLTDPARPPVYIAFSTEASRFPPTPADPNPKQMTFEHWHGLAAWDKKHDPAAGVTVAPSAPAPNAPPLPPDGYTPDGLPVNGPPARPATATAGGAAPPRQYDPKDNPQYQPDDDKPEDLEAEVNELVTLAMDDPEGATEDGAMASARLEELAWAAGWTAEDTAGAEDWAAVGRMALRGPGEADEELEGGNDTPPNPAIGSRWRFARRTKDGGYLKNSKGEPFPPQEVEVTAVDLIGGTCTLKTVKDGKPVVDIRSKKPIPVKFEWLESPA